MRKLSSKKFRLPPPISWAHGILFLLVACSPVAWADAGGTITGMVQDPANRVVANAQITVRETTTGFEQHTESDSLGHYIFAVLPVGNYELRIEAPGFKMYRRLGISLDTAASLTLDATLTVGDNMETVDVTDDAVHVETSSTQMGETVTARQMTAVPLNGRSFTDLLSLQAGVAPETSITSDTVQDVGATVLQPSGTLNPGTISVNGQREFANLFEVNGSNAQEDVNSGTSIVPNLDSIAEFRIITNNFDAERGEYSGGQVLVVTKSGTNLLHGSLLEFLRNTAFDSRNYFSLARGAFRQNQFGGTLGGPIRRNKLFWFADYQGTLQTQGIDTPDIGVPSNLDRSGNLSDQARTMTGAVSGPYLATLLSQKFGYPVTTGEPSYTTGCVLNSQCVFPNAIIPAAAWSGPVQALLPYIPAPNTPSGTFSTSAFNLALHDNKGSARLDANTAWGLISAYYFLDSYNLDNPYPVAQSGANVPGFSALSTGRAQLFTVGDTKLLSTTSVNEFHLNFLR